MKIVMIIRHYLDTGGFAAWAIFFTGIALLAISLERIYFLYFVYSTEAESSLHAIRTEIHKQSYAKALQICNQNPTSPSLQVVKAGLLAVENGREAMKSALSSSVMEVSESCENRLSFLGLIASSSTLLGLFGTIVGLISTFAAMASADASMKAKLLGSGISEAMFSTAGGLIVGVAAMVIHTICLGRADLIVSRAQKSGLNLITWIEQSERERKVG